MVFPVLICGLLCLTLLVLAMGADDFGPHIIIPDDCALAPRQKV